MSLYCLIIDGRCANCGWVCRYAGVVMRRCTPPVCTLPEIEVDETNDVRLATQENNAQEIRS